MQTPLEIHCESDIQLLPEVEADLRAKVAKMDLHCGGDMINCRAHMGRGANVHHNSGPYDVRLVVQAKGGEFAASKQDHSLHTAMRDACKAMLHQLEAHHAKLRKAVKTHVLQPTATVARLLEDHGFLLAVDGHEIYFHRNSLVGLEFDTLKRGDAVSFVEQPGDKGPQASTVRRQGGAQVAEMMRVPAT